MGFAIRLNRQSLTGLTYTEVELVFNMGICRGKPLVLVYPKFEKKN